MNLANARTTGTLLLAIAFATAASTACRRAPSPAQDQRSACERALGSWQGDDIEAPDPEPAAVELGRTMVRTQHWRIAETLIETHEGGRPTREAARIVVGNRDRCDVELSLGDRRRTLTLEPMPDGRLRVRATGRPIAMILRREPGH